MKLCFLDTETTGVNPKTDGIIQIAGKLQTEINGKIEHLENFNFIMQPFDGSTISDEALAKQNRTKADLATYQANWTGYQLFTNLLKKYVNKYDKKDKFFLIGYNAKFDYDMLREWFNKNGDKYFGSWFWYPPIDVMNLAARYLMSEREKLKDFKLGTVCEYLNITAEGQLHDAHTDITLTEKLYRRLI